MNSKKIRRVVKDIDTCTVKELMAVFSLLHEESQETIWAITGALKATDVPSVRKNILQEVMASEILLEGYGDRKIGCIKVVREHTGLPLKEAKELVEAAPVRVRAYLTKLGYRLNEERKFVDDLREQGAKLRWI